MIRAFSFKIWSFGVLWFHRIFFSVGYLIEESLFARVRADCLFYSLILSFYIRIYFTKDHVPILNMTRIKFNIIQMRVVNVPIKFRKGMIASCQKSREGLKIVNKSFLTKASGRCTIPLKTVLGLAFRQFRFSYDLDSTALNLLKEKTLLITPSVFSNANYDEVLLINNIFLLMALFHCYSGVSG